MRLVFFFATLVSWGTPFNLEPRVAVVKEGVKGTYFGYQVSQHQIITRDRLESVLLVGAPLARDVRGFQQGVVWKCPFTARPDDCIKLNLDPIDRKEAEKSERGGQWLGALIRSQGAGKKVITCAPRYVKQEADQRWGHGKCFTLTQTLQHSATWDPCEGREKYRAHEDWGYCQAGMSALLTADNTALIGSPGPYTWRGTVFSLSADDDYLFRDKTHYHTPVRPGEAPVDKYSYLGMSLATGNFLPRSQSCGQEASYASGAPRAGGTGQVVLFVKCVSELLRVQRVLRGEKFASSFGYSMASADLNADGFVDLIVGAPFYHDQGGGGAVYVYLNSNNGIEDQSKVKLVGKAESRFGFALANAGDLNNDGFQDIIVGAPYDERGKVFVYMGGEDGIKEKPTQVIASEQIMGRFPASTFGYSLDGGLDMDLNNHSDIVVGAFDSDVAYIIRSRPVIDIVTWFGEHPERINPKISGCQDDLLSPEVCFPMESCFLIKNFPSNIDTTYIKYKLEAEVFPGGRKMSRVRFGDYQSNTTHVSERVIAIQKNKLTGCFLEMAYLRKESYDLITPVTFRLSLKLEQDVPVATRAGITNINQYPILNQQEAVKDLTLPFQMSCGEDDICSSQLSTSLEIEGLDPSTHQLELKAKREVQLVINVTNSGESAYAAFLYLDIDPSFTFVGRSDTTSDISCEFSEIGKISCELGNPYESSRSDQLVFRVLPQLNKEISEYAFFNVSHETSSVNSGPQEKQSFKVQVVKRAEVSIRSVVQPEEIWYGGDLLGESAMKSISDIGSRVLHTFQVTNEGPWHVSDFEVHIEWPFQLAVPNRPYNEPGKWLLYLVSKADLTPKKSGVCFINPRMINQLGLREMRHIPKRRRRRRRRKRSIFSSNHILNCAANERLKCHVLTCRFRQLGANEDVVIRLKSRVWNSTLVEEFSHSDRVELQVSARVVLSPESAACQNSGDDSTVSILVGYPSVTSDSLANIPLWVILLAVTIGVFLVVIIILVLYKIGFFKRHRHPNDVLISAKVTNAANSKGDEYIS